MVLGGIYGFDENTTDVASLELPNQMVRVRVGEIPTGIDVDSNSGLLYVANSGSDYISVINGSSNTVVKNVSLEASVSNIAVNPSTKIIYAVGENAKAVLLVSGVTLEQVGRIPLIDYPDHITIDEKRNIIYVTSAGHVFVINGTDNKIIGNKPVGTSPSAIAVNSKTNLVYIANNDYSGNPYNNSLIYVMDGITRDIVAAIQVALNPYDINVNEKTNMVYVINEDGNRVSVINGSTNNISDIIVTNGSYSPQGIMVSSIAVNPATNMVYTVNTGSDAINTINASSSKTSVGTISATGSIFSDLTINPGNNILYVTDQGANIVYSFGGNATSISLADSGIEIIDQERIGKIGITLNERPRDIAVDSSSNNLYIIDLLRN